MAYSIFELAQKVNGTVIGNQDIAIKGITSFEKPCSEHITFVSNPKNLKELESTEIACVLVPKQITTSKKPLIQVDNPKLAFALLLPLFNPPRTFSGKISDKALIAKTALIGKDVTIEPFVCIGERVKIGDHSVIRSHSYIDNNVTIGEHTTIHPNVSVQTNVTIGNRVIIHSGVVIGSDGFGFVFDGKQQVKLPQVGLVIIEDDVEIGACTTIDRAAMGETIVGQGTKIDNQVHLEVNKLGIQIAPGAMDDIVMRARKTFTMDDDFTAVALDVNGGKVPGKDGITPLSIKPNTNPSIISLN